MAIPRNALRPRYQSSREPSSSTSAPWPRPNASMATTSALPVYSAITPNAYTGWNPYMKRRTASPYTP